MFGDIFDTQEELISGKGTNILTAEERRPKNCSFYLDLPPLVRMKNNFVGIKNQGATCYLNSLFQALYMSPEFRNAIFSLPLCVFKNILFLMFVLIYFLIERKIILKIQAVLLLKIN